MIETSEKEHLGDVPNHPDLLSSLPLSIIHNIITLIPIREAVRTCILSSQWRYVWVTLPNLVFEEEHYSDFRSKDKFEESMENFITNILLHHKGPIYKFQMSVSFSPNTATMGQWIMCLSRNNIRELIIDMNYYDYYSLWLHSSIYSCEKLTFLRLFNCRLEKPPSSFKGFLFLRVLHLQRVHMYIPSSDEIDSVFTNSPLLETLDVIHSLSLKLWFDAPSLKYLSLRGEYEEMSLHAPLLTVMEINLLDGEFEIGGGEDYECNYTHFLGRFTNLEKLNLNLQTMKYLSLDIVSSHRSLVFPRLKDVELGVNFQHIRHVFVAARLVIGAPNLEKLTIDCRRGEFTDFQPNLIRKKLSVMDIRSALASTFEKLRVAKMTHVTGRLLEMEFIKYLLENSPLLEVMTFEIWYEHPAEKKQILREVLLSCTCASPIAKITVTECH